MASLTDAVACAAVALGKWPREVWEEADMEDVPLVIRAHQRLAGHDPDAPKPDANGKVGPKIEPLTALDRALIQRERDRLARLAAESE